jgi:hypothetical protein
MKKILIAETNDLTAGPLAQAIQDLGYEPLFLIQPEEHAGEVLNSLQQVPVRWVQERLDDHGLLKLTKKNNGVAGILTLADLYVPQAARVARCREIRGLAPEVAELNNKAVLQQAMPEYVPPGMVLNAPPSAAERSALVDLLTRFGKLRMKPACGTGGVGQVTIAGKADLDAFLCHCPDWRWVAQVHLPSNQYGLYSLEGFVHQGCLHEVGISRRRRRGATETGSFFPVHSDERITPAVRERMRRVIQTACARVSVAPQAQNFWFHAEFLVGPDGQVFWIDPNLGRIGGAAILWHLALSMGVGPALIARHFVSLTLGIGSLPDLPRARIETESILYTLDTPATITAVDDSESRLPIHVRLVDPGMTVSEYAPDNWDVIGIAVGTAPQKIPAQVDKIRIHTSDGRVLQPCY